MKDLGIKLFGKRIQLLNDCGVFGEDCCFEKSSYLCEEKCEKVGEIQDFDKVVSEEKFQHKESDQIHSLMSEEHAEPCATSAINISREKPTVSDGFETSKAEEDQNETTNSQEKMLKKPDKILPCPRCNSMDTKFCYYNNYNVSQPRYFCKNCQRYWTAGGTMRNMLVGAGRRKNKTSVFHYRQLSVPEALYDSRPDLPNGFQHQPALNTNASLVTFGSDNSLESMASVLNIAEEPLKVAKKPMLPNGNLKPVDNRSNGSLTTEMQSCHSFPQIPCFPGMPLPYPWHPSMGPAFFPGGFPMPLFYPEPPYWGCSVPPGPWNVPWITPRPNLAGGHGSGPKFQTLGKHARDEHMLKSEDLEEEEKQEKEKMPKKCLWIPKTLRIDNPDEASKSTIWDTLGIKNERSGPVIGGGGLFKAFLSKGDGKVNHISKTSAVLHANPAALSRSLDFQERSCVGGFSTV